MKNIIIGDIHGRSSWNKIIESNKSDEDINYVFVGDYFDSYEKNISFYDEKDIFLDICQFKMDNMDRVTLLHGNHDYLSYVIREQCSRYQAKHAHSIVELLNDNSHLIDSAIEIDNYLITHAGVTNTWFNRNGLDIKNPAKSINELWEKSPDEFRFDLTEVSWTGDTIHQGPLWLRPASLVHDRLEDWDQIVGHTKFHNIHDEKGILFIDTRLTSYLLLDGDEWKEILI